MTSIIGCGLAEGIKLVFVAPASGMAQFRDPFFCLLVHPSVNFCDHPSVNPTVLVQLFKASLA